VFESDDCAGEHFVHGESQIIHIVDREVPVGRE
jgi:hypothetical protein